MTTEQKDKTPVQRLLVPSYILATARILTKISPLLASRFAARLFLTPFRYPLPDREKWMDRQSTQQVLSLPHSGKKIVVYTCGEATRKILLVHGWSGRGTQMSDLAKSLLQAGYSVVSFDAPAHGKAPGKKSMMPHFVEAIHLLDQRYGPFEAAVGHSLGGMAGLRAVKEGLSIGRLVIIGTANSITKITREFAQNMKMNEEVARRMKKYLDGKFGQDMDTYSGAVSAEEVSIPTLVVHDYHDVDVKVNEAFEIHEKLAQSELLLTKRLGHRKILGDKEVINKIIAFLSV